MLSILKFGEIQIQRSVPFFAGHMSTDICSALDLKQKSTVKNGEHMINSYICNKLIKPLPQQKSLGCAGNWPVSARPVLENVNHGPFVGRFGVGRSKDQWVPSPQP